MIDVRSEECINMANEEVHRMCYSTGCCDYPQNCQFTSWLSFVLFKWGPSKINLFQGWQTLKQHQHQLFATWLYQVISADQYLSFFYLVVQTEQDIQSCPKVSSDLDFHLTLVLAQLYKLAPASNYNTFRCMGEKCCVSVKC